MTRLIVAMHLLFAFIHTGLVQMRDNLITLGLLVLVRSVLAFFVGLDQEQDPSGVDRPMVEAKGEAG